MSVFTLKERGTALDAHDLMSKISTFMQTNTDFVLVKDGAVDLDNHYVFLKNGTYYNFKSFIKQVPYSNPVQADTDSWTDVNEDRNEGVCMNLSTGYDSLVEWDRQANYFTQGAPILRCLNDVIEYDIVFNGDLVYIICQYEFMKFSHMVFGKMDSFYNEVIDFCSATFYHQFAPLTINQTELVNLYNYTNEIGQNIKIKNNVCSNFSGNILTNSFLTTKTNLERPFYNIEELKRSLNPFSSKHTLVEGLFFKERLIDVTNTKYYPSEKFSGFYFVYFENFTEKEEFTIGSRKYIAFPFTQKTSPFDDTDVNSSGLGVLIEVNDYLNTGV